MFNFDFPFDTHRRWQNVQVADALMKHATDKQFDLNPPVPDNIAALAKEAEDEMKIDAKVLATGKARR